MSVDLLRLNYEMPVIIQTEYVNRQTSRPSRALQATLERKVRSPADWHRLRGTAFCVRGIACLVSPHAFFSVATAFLCCVVRSGRSDATGLPLGCCDVMALAGAVRGPARRANGPVRRGQLAALSSPHSFVTASFPPAQARERVAAPLPLGCMARACHSHAQPSCAAIISHPSTLSLRSRWHLRRVV